MKCEELESWMLTDETPNRPPLDVRRHLRSCASCRRQFARLVRLIHEVETAPLPPIPSAARTNLFAQLEPPASIPMPTPAQRRSTAPWLRWAAAAVLFLGLGLSIAVLTRPRPQDPTPQANRSEPVEDRVLARHLELAETNEPAQRLTSLNGMASDVRTESLASARKGASDDLSLLSWLHARILHEGVLRTARELRGSKEVIAPVVAKLQEAEKELVSQSHQVSEQAARPLQEMGQQVRDAVAALEGGPDSPAPAAQPPVIVGTRALLQTLVVSSLQVANEDSPLRRAEHSADVAGRLADVLIEQGEQVPVEQVNRLTRSLEQVMEQAVQGNLDQMDSEKANDADRKRVAQMQKQAQTAVQMVEKKMPRLPAEAQKNLQRAMELAKQMQMSKHTHAKPKPKKPRTGKEK